MSIEYSHDLHEFYAYCDQCNQEVNEDADTFQDAVNRLKELGWKMMPHDEIWYHFCSPICHFNSDVP